MRAHVGELLLDEDVSVVSVTADMYAADYSYGIN